LVIEAAPEEGLPARIIPELAYRSLPEMIKLPLVAQHLAPLLERHRKSMDIIRERSEAREGVIFSTSVISISRVTTNLSRICCIRSASILSV